MLRTREDYYQPGIPAKPGEHYVHSFVSREVMRVRLFSILAAVSALTALR